MTASVLTLHLSRFPTYTAGLASHIRLKSLRSPEPQTRQLAAASLFSILSAQGPHVLEAVAAEEMDSLADAKDSRSVHGTLLLLAEMAGSQATTELKQAARILALRWLQSVSCLLFLFDTRLDSRILEHTLHAAFDRIVLRSSPSDHRLHYLEHSGRFLDGHNSHRPQVDLEALCRNRTKAGGAAFPRSCRDDWGCYKFTLRLPDGAESHSTDTQGRDIVHRATVCHAHLRRLRLWAALGVPGACGHCHRSIDEAIRSEGLPSSVQISQMDDWTDEPWFGRTCQPSRASKRRETPWTLSAASLPRTRQTRKSVREARQGQAVQIPRLTAHVLQDLPSIIRSMQNGMDDYTTDERGDVSIPLHLRLAVQCPS